MCREAPLSSSLSSIYIKITKSPPSLCSGEWQQKTADTQQQHEAGTDISRERLSWLHSAPRWLLSLDGER